MNRSPDEHPGTTFGEPVRPHHATPLIDPFLAAQDEADLRGGAVVLRPDGRLEVRTHGTVIEGTVLPSERFAAPTDRRRTEEQAVVRELAQAGTRWLDILVPVSAARAQGWPLPPDAPDGWYVRTAHSRRYGDHLHAIVVLLEETGLYHVLLWQYVCHEDGEDTRLPLADFLDRLPTLSRHGVHVFTTNVGTVLCLSEQPWGGLPRLDTALARTVQWLEGAGRAIRGKRFPYAS